MDDWAYVRLRRYFWYAIIAVGVSIACQYVFFSPLSFVGAAQFQVALLGDAAVVLRLVIARIRKEQGAVWVIYSLLPFAFIPIITLTTSLYFGR